MSDDAYLFEEDGVKWTVTRNEKGEISYLGLDKDGKEVTMPPSSVIKAAENHDFSRGDNTELQAKLAKDISLEGYESVTTNVNGKVIGTKEGGVSEEISIAVAGHLKGEMNELGVDSYTVQSKTDNTSDNVESREVDSVAREEAEKEAEKNDKKGEGRSPSENQEKGKEQTSSLEDAMPSIIRGNNKTVEGENNDIGCAKKLLELSGRTAKASMKVIKDAVESNIKSGVNTRSSGRGARSNP